MHWILHSKDKYISEACYYMEERKCLQDHCIFEVFFLGYESIYQKGNFHVSNMLRMNMVHEMEESKAGEETIKWEVFLLLTKTHEF